VSRAETGDARTDAARGRSAVMVMTVSSGSGAPCRGSRSPTMPAARRRHVRSGTASDLHVPE
jgi:hypothetical protein